MKKIPVWGKVLLWVLAAVLILAAAAYGVIHAKLGKINRINPDEIEMVSPKDETFETDPSLDKTQDMLNPDDVVWNDDGIDVMRDNDVSNILLIGQDRREGEGRQRSDSMIICSLNRKTNKIILTSVMRDLYVPIPGYSDNRINAAYQFGGMALLDRVIEESLGVSIDGNIEVDFDGFIASLSQIGNLDITLNDAEAAYLNKNNGWNLKGGVNSLTPEQTLAYSRTRYVGNSDWERTDRQRRVIMAAFDKVKDRGLTALLNLADSMFPYLTTDMSDGQLLGYIYTIVTNGMTEFESYRIPVEGTYTNETLSRGMEVLVPDLMENSRFLQQYIYGKK